MARQRRRNLLPDEETENFWPSFTDLTSTIALILFMLVLLAFLQNLASGKRLEQVRDELRTTLASLGAAKTQVDQNAQQLKLLAGQLEVGRAELKLSQDRLAAQQQVITDSSVELNTLRTQLQGIAVLRLDVLQKVKQSIEARLGASAGRAQVIIADNGNIVINESVVFESDSYTIKPAGKPLLDTLAHAFANVLGDPAVRENIDVILVQGHTDERGSVAYNRDLSAKRANAVVDHLFAADPSLEERYGSYFASSAYSEFRPLRPGQSPDAYAQNRRIELSVVLRDANVGKLIDAYMQGVDPALQPTQAAPAAPTPAP
ncbi:MAG: OmpA family protein [Polyangiales bacterium]